MPPFEYGYQPRHAGGWHHSTTYTSTYEPRHADVDFSTDIEWATGLNAATLLGELRSHGLDIVRRVTA